MSTLKMLPVTARTLAALVGGAVAAACFAHTTVAANPNPKGKEKCYGVAKAGENGCAATNGSHSCGGLSKANFSGQEWKLVGAGTCEKLGGKREAFNEQQQLPVPLPMPTPKKDK